MQGRPCKGGFCVFIFSLMHINLANPSLSQQTSLPFSLTFWLAPKSNKKGARKLKRNQTSLTTCTRFKKRETPLSACAIIGEQK